MSISSIRSVDVTRLCNPWLISVLRVIVQLPCRNLSALKREICEVFLQFMGGDLSLIPELQANHARQQALVEEGKGFVDCRFQARVVLGEEGRQPWQQLSRDSN